MMMLMCASCCGVAEVDDVKLKDCSACDLVRYCSDECQNDHRPQHKGACKKRAAELRDEILFKQPESSDLGDCPICCLPLSLDRNLSILNECCGKLVCVGCDYANLKREFQGRLQPKCLFCRQPMKKNVEERERNTRMMKRVEANDPVAIYEMGVFRYEEGDYEGAFEYLTKGAELGDAGAHYLLSWDGVEEDENKRVHHLEEAAIGGHPDARHNLSSFELRNGRMDRAVKHAIIAANLGHDISLGFLKSAYKVGGLVGGLISKDDFAATLRAHQAAVDATKSAQREEAEAGRRVM
eukprot:CAMPEP_0113415472 /NCGR_PEP_ID=MMETSP0013_2-20120614/24582_1 /TAXON_ID=2843 ORGANISM="Skeletonema costatum, Strain 1716" /NCGR_SAMPLE_ID=MMETSP0013_2 /ASSEMBLY_ACC=CAM_ASM_000158 /LENGTH=295 /DNA_ID=CAMNT_0000302425 /DNA_START=120 /DNA_END=1008 /DNA_ORIENTATION=- /assembly_acc=CAM_ASM_000158